eukprot:GFYU01007293.1.p1 GENE.GFYU01007293.1~~GFYU01007293.1.p1  ORF type:complete len:270 (-),score=10.12 GFYU01007293.1:218-1027(-)
MRRLISYCPLVRRSHAGCSQRFGSDTVPRSHLTALYSEHRYDDLAAVPGLELVERRDWRRDQEARHDCIWYVREHAGITWAADFSFAEWRPRGHIRVHPSWVRGGDIAVYFSDPRGARENHAAIIVKPPSPAQPMGIALSKFGYGHVFRHPLDLVPGDYGPRLKYYRRVVPEPNDVEKPDPSLQDLEERYEVAGRIYSLKLTYEERDLLRPFLDANRDKLSVRLLSSSTREGGKEDYVIYSVVSYGWLDDGYNRAALLAAYNAASGVPG